MNLSYQRERDSITLKKFALSISFMMKLLLIFYCVFAASAAFLLPPFRLPSFGRQKETLSNICVYSSDPARYKPKCFLCPNSAYPNILRACVDSTSIPFNVSYTQASCLEENCAINYPQGTRSTDFRVKRQAPEFTRNSSLGSETVPSTTRPSQNLLQTGGNGSVSGVTHSPVSTTSFLQHHEETTENKDTRDLPVGETSSHAETLDETPVLQGLGDDDTGEEIASVDEDPSESVVEETVLINGREYRITRHEVVFAVAEAFDDF
ncbi:uncharacterized protein LOC118194569 isoform X2 [Stegodyphus dumicola]|uniref:uncharacterized protein LOC118194569 isoform X2 n=1 Tax=Stegodyphus dumicola TaxID=202533 RepID=UPI0015AE1522|nr:uncharacterized protein LOC118194569 isoform X2 [Stegodyphus dumicola]